MGRRPGCDNGSEERQAGKILVLFDGTRKAESKLGAKKTAEQPEARSEFYMTKMSPRKL